MAAINSITETLDSLITTTWYNVQKQLIDTINKITPFFDKLNTNGKFRAKVPDGTRWEVPIRYAEEDQNTGYFSRGDLAGTAEKETMTRLIFYRKFVWTAIVRYFTDDTANVGPAKILDYAQEKVDGAKESLFQLFEQDTINTSSDTNAINALEGLIPEDPTTGTLGGLTRSGNTFLQNQYKDCTGLTTGTSLIDEMERMYNLCSEYKSGTSRVPDLILTSRKLFQDYKRVARAMGIINVNPVRQRVDLGFGDLSYNNAEMFWSPDCADDRMYVINTENIEFRYDPRVWFDMTPWKPLQGNSLDRTAQCVSICNLVIDCPPKLGVMFDWSPTTS